MDIVSIVSLILNVRPLVGSNTKNQHNNQKQLIVILSIIRKEYYILLPVQLYRCKCYLLVDRERVVEEETKMDRQKEDVKQATTNISDLPPNLFPHL